MKNNFHPKSIVSINANIDPSSIIGPNCVIGENVKIGKNCKLISNVVIDGNTTIGDGCEFYPFSVIGMVPQDLKYKGEKTFLKIGNQNIFREHSTIHLGTESGGGTTIIGNNNLIMTGTHVAHDCKIGNNIVLSHHVHPLHIWKGSTTLLLYLHPDRQHSCQPNRKKSELTKTVALKRALTCVCKSKHVHARHAGRAAPCASAKPSGRPHP